MSGMEPSVAEIEPSVTGIGPSVVGVGRSIIGIEPSVIGIETALRRRLRQGGKGLAPFLAAGFPDRRIFVALLREAEQRGCDVVEVGLPFSDPIADGPTIQFASQCSLAGGTTVRNALEDIHSAAVSVPVVLMSYLNPLLAYGLSRLEREAAAVGVRGVIIPDLPALEEVGLNSAVERFNAQSRAGAFGSRKSPGRAPGGGKRPARAAHGVGRSDEGSGVCERILLATPNTRPVRLRAVGWATRGFLYAVTVTGVTGARRDLPAETARFLGRARRATPRPVLAGFGIADAPTAASLAEACDGVVVGSALIDEIRRGQVRTATKRVGRFLQELRRAL